MPHGCGFRNWKRHCKGRVFLSLKCTRRTDFPIWRKLTAFRHKAAVDRVGCRAGGPRGFLHSDIFGPVRDCVWNPFGPDRPGPVADSFNPDLQCCVVRKDRLDTAFGWLAPGFGRRPVFVEYVIEAAVPTPICGATRDSGIWFLIGPVIGFLWTGWSSIFGTMPAELYPLSIWGAMQAFVYSTGRGFSSMASWLLVFFVDRDGMGTAMGLNSACFLLGAVLILTFLETSGCCWIRNILVPIIGR